MGSTQPIFYLGLNMSGAVSAGAYTAGVVDFLFDALDTLYLERARQTAKYGSDFSKWEIPAHEIRLVVMAGASAGGITAALAAASLCEDFTPARCCMPATAPNRLYKSWVEDIDISYLLGSADLPSPSSPVVSLLDSTRLDEIASAALKIDHPSAAGKRPYVADGLKLILTVTNLGGVPYAIESNNGAEETQTLYHADQAAFEVCWEKKESGAAMCQLRPDSPENWPALADAAKATSAFPIALAPRALNRSTTFYNERAWRVSVDNPQATDGDCGCEATVKMRPNWPYADDVPFRTLNVDGGVTNNSPFDCAHQELSLQEPASDGHNPRSARSADRAVVSIAPFLTSPSFSIGEIPSADLFSVFTQLVGTLVNQSRIQGENIKLTRDPSVFSRFVIAPSIDKTTINALASSSLGAFGGFLAKEFRDHDYQLGRRNCQRFLKQHFGLPLDNIVIRQYAPKEEFLRDFGFTLDDGSPGLALIPVLGDLNTPIPEARTPIKQARLEAIADQALERLKLVGGRLLTSRDPSWVTQAAFKAIWLMTQGKLKQGLLTRIGYELARQGLID